MQSLSVGQFVGDEWFDRELLVLVGSCYITREPKTGTTVDADVVGTNDPNP